MEFDLSPSDIRKAFALRAGSTSTELRLWRRMPGFRCYFCPTRPTDSLSIILPIPATSIHTQRLKFTWETPLNYFAFWDMLFLFKALMLQLIGSQINKAVQKHKCIVGLCSCWIYHWISPSHPHSVSHSYDSHLYSPRVSLVAINKSACTLNVLFALYCLTIIIGS